MKYKVGDKVRIRADLKVGKEYDEATVVENMKRYFGKTTTIRYVYEYCYTLDVDDGDWIWTDGMLEVDDTPQIAEPKTVDVGYRIDSCGRCRVLKDVIQGDMGIKRIYYTKDYGFQYILPIEWIEFIIPHEEKESKE